MIDDFKSMAKRAVGIPEPTRLQFTDTDGSKAEIIIDCTKVIETTLSSQVSKFPVEAGFSISDHSITAPRVLKLSGEITESPITMTTIVQNLAKATTSAALGSVGLSNGFLKAAAGAGISLGVGAGADAFLGGGVYSERTVMKALGDRKALDVNYPKRMQVALTQLSDFKIPVRVTTYFNQSMYDSMVVKSISFSQNNKNSDNLNFNMILQQVTTVQLEKSRIDIPKKTEGTVSDPAGSSAANKVKKGSNAGYKVKTSTDSFGDGAGKLLKFMVGK